MAEQEEQTAKNVAVPVAPDTSVSRDGDPLPPPPATNGRPTNPEAMRVEIQHTRARMSHTLDAIEDRLVRQKRELWAKATLQDFRRTVSTEPWRSVAIAFLAGYIVAAIRD